MILTGLEGYLSGAWPKAAPAQRHNSDATRIPKRFIIPSPFRRRCLFVGDASSTCRFDAMQAVRGVLNGEEDDVAFGAGLAGMHDIGRHVDHRTGLGLDCLA